MLLRNTIMLITVSMMTACAGVPQSDLVAVSDGSMLRLPKDVKFVYRSISPLSAPIEYWIFQGEYRSAFADQKGTYYQGPRLCFRSKLPEPGFGLKRLEGKFVSVADCGLYVPRDSRESISVYTVLGTGASIIFGHSIEDIEALLADAARGQSSSPLPNQDSGAVNSLVSSSVSNTSATPMQAGVAGGVAGGLVAALAAAEKGRFEIFHRQPSPDHLKDVIRIPAQP